MCTHTHTHTHTHRLFQKQETADHRYFRYQSQACYLFNMEPVCGKTWVSESLVNVPESFKLVPNEQEPPLGLFT